MEEIAGKTAFVTGGASGIGLGMAEAFLAAGMNVVIADLRPDHVESALQRLDRSGARTHVHAIELDVTDREAFARAADEAETVFGNVHVLCNNAGMGILGPVTLARYDDWDWGLGVLLGGVVNGIQTFLPRLIAHGEGGHIVNTASMAGVVPIPGAAIYITAKAAVIGLSEALRSELAGEGIGVSAFCPGTPTPATRSSSRSSRSGPTRRSGWTHVNAESASSRASAATTCTSSPTGNSARAPTNASARCSPRFRTNHSTTKGRTTSDSCSPTRSSARCSSSGLLESSVGRRASLTFSLTLSSLAG